MNLNNFEKIIETKIIDRGFSYYKYNAIEVLEEVDQNEFSATVNGSRAYTVYIQLDKQKNIVEHSCDCPYDWSDVCKHKVAVFYYLKDTDFSGSSYKKSKVQIMKKDLKKLSQKDLVDMIVEMSKENRVVKQMVWKELGYE